jgi:hypothetical protein
VGAEPGTAELGRQLRGDARDRQAAGVGGEDDSGLEERGDSGKKLLLDRQILGDCFQDPIAFGKKAQVMLEAAGPDEADGGRVVKGRWLGAAEGLERGGGDALAGISGQVEQHYRDTGVGQMGGNAHSHSARTQYRSMLNHPRAGECRAG